MANLIAIVLEGLHPSCAGRRSIVALQLLLSRCPFGQLWCAICSRCPPRNVVPPPLFALGACVWGRVLWVVVMVDLGALVSHLWVSAPSRPSPLPTSGLPAPVLHLPWPGARPTQGLQQVLHCTHCRQALWRWTLSLIKFVIWPHFSPRYCGQAQI